ncbi:hypothetical protein [Shimazuella alba]|uniref:Uncharacterized protein n=1 Tax=Shimazuella alba TaxID=2690964 RepID=A0A6I4VUK6_9BACL|nr:hypothetical protein [Shimazuella alba]MXQ53476.1 hypothetical protein [Shimazuella alba]
MQTQKLQAKNAFLYGVITLVSIIVVPLLLLGCAWLTQHPYFGIAGYFVAFLILWITGHFFGFSVFSGVGISVFVFLMFTGPALSYLYLEKTGIKQTAIIVDIRHYNVVDTLDGFYYSERDWDCKLVTTDRKPIRYALENENGCLGNLKAGQKIEIVEDPSGWVRPMTAAKLYGSPSWESWVSAGIGLLFQVWILFRLRSRK